MWCFVIHTVPYSDSMCPLFSKEALSLMLYGMVTLDYSMVITRAEWPLPSSLGYSMYMYDALVNK